MVALLVRIRAKADRTNDRLAIEQTRYAEQSSYRLGAQAVDNRL
jgi:hypothetical protein